MPFASSVGIYCSAILTRTDQMTSLRFGGYGREIKAFRICVCCSVSPPPPRASGPSYFIWYLGSSDNNLEYCLLLIQSYIKSKEQLLRTLQENTVSPHAAWRSKVEKEFAVIAYFQLALRELREGLSLVILTKVCASTYRKHCVRCVISKIESALSFRTQRVWMLSTKQVQVVLNLEAGTAVKP